MKFQRIEILLIFIFSFPILLNAENGNRNHGELNNINSGNNNNCITCHEENNIETSSSTNPVWINKSEISEFNTYEGNHLTSQDGFPSGGSKLCLGCHDGIVAVEDKNIYTNVVSTAGIGGIGFPSHNNHPISIIYNSALASQNRGLADPSFEPSGLGGTIEEDLLEDGKIVCTSCHNIHQIEGREFSAKDHFNANTESPISLKITNRESALCLTCHKK